MTDLGVLEQELLRATAAAADENALEKVRVAALGKSGSISALLKGLGSIPADQRKQHGARINGLKERHGRMPYTKGSLKARLYGTSHPSLAIETEAMMTAAARLSQNLPTLERLFPHGFGALLKSLRSW